MVAVADQQSRCVAAAVAGDGYSSSDVGVGQAPRRWS